MSTYPFNTITHGPLQKEHSHGPKRWFAQKSVKKMICPKKCGHIGTWGRERVPILFFYADQVADSRKPYGTVQGSEIGLRKKRCNFKIYIAAQPYIWLEKQKHIQNSHTKIYFFVFSSHCCHVTLKPAAGL